MEYEFYLVNAFTDAAFSGNGAGVCLIPSSKDASDTLKQKLAAEINLSETAFITSYTEKSDFQSESRFGLRWFTPATEVPLCGHATLASSAVLFHHINNRNQKITFDTLSGPLVVEKGTGNGSIRMEFPLRDTIVASGENNINSLVKATVGDLPVNEVHVSSVARMALIRLDDTVTRKQFESFNPIGSELIKAGNNVDYIGVIVTLKGSKINGSVDDQGNTYDFISRFFAPWSGIDEDPVTGSAHAVLGPFWAKHLGKTKLYACQSSKRRGELWLEVNQLGSSVVISGKFFTYFKGHVII